MVRALACHARGRGFETLHSRQLTTLFKSEVVIRMVSALTMSAARRHAVRPVMEVWIASQKSIGAEKSTTLRKSGTDQPNNNSFWHMRKLSDALSGRTTCAHANVR